MTDRPGPHCPPGGDLDHGARPSALALRTRQAINWLKYQLRLLPCRPRLIWGQLWLRRDEFHPSLDIDVDAMLRMNEPDRARYLQNLTRRRNAAHERDLAS